MFRAIHSETISHSWRHVPHHLHHNCYCYHHPHQNIQYHLFLTPFVKKTQPRQWHSLFVLYCYTSDLTNGIRYKTQEQIWSSVMGWACLSNPTLQCRWYFVERESEIFPLCLCATREHLSVESAKAKRRSIDPWAKSHTLRKWKCVQARVWALCSYKIWTRCNEIQMNV